MFLITIQYAYTQEDKLNVEESAAVFLEEYTDEFQESFFEALKQKGIQNYDRAINSFLECKNLEPENNVINHELAKAYLLDKKYISGQEYAIEALVVEPSNYWYLDTLLQLLEKQSNTLETVKNTIPYNTPKLQENLALIYYKKRRYAAARKILKELKNSDFKEELTSKINQAVQKPSQEQEVKSTGPISVTAAKNDDNTSSTKGLELTLKSQIKLEQYRIVEKKAKDAVEAYPLQPFFYYAYGLSLYKNNKSREAIEVLESSLDYLFDDISLANKIYKTLADAYTKMNNLSKANLYLSKVKPGF